MSEPREPSAEEVRRRDGLLVALTRLVRGHPRPFQAAGRRLWERATATITRDHEHRRREVEAELALVEAAKSRALDTTVPPVALPPGVDAANLRKFADALWWYRKFFRGFRVYQRCRGSLSEVSAVDAHVEYWARWLSNCRRRGGYEPESLDETMAERREELDPERARHCLATYPWHLAHSLLRFMAAPLDEPWTCNEYLEAVVLVLLTYVPDLAEAELGIPTRLRWGEWKLPDQEGDTFDHRDGMRSYVDLTDCATIAEQRRRQERLWVLVERAKLYLSAHEGWMQVGPAPDSVDGGATRGLVDGDAPKVRGSGRQRRPDAPGDIRVWEAWKTGSYRLYAELARELGRPTPEVAAIVDRFGARERRQQARDASTN